MDASKHEGMSPASDAVSVETSTGFPAFADRDPK